MYQFYSVIKCQVLCQNFDSLQYIDILDGYDQFNAALSNLYAMVLKICRYLNYRISTQNKSNGRNLKVIS